MVVMVNLFIPVKRSTAGILRHSLYVGLQARVAKKIGVSRQMVSLVMAGQRTSKKVTAALQKECDRIEREVLRMNGRAA